MNVLLVDDEENSRSELADFLRNCGHEVKEAGNAYDAIKVLHSEEFQLVLTDNRMPKMSGIELLREIKASPCGQDVYFVVLTAYGDMQTVIEAIRAGAYDYLLKPINIDELIGVTQRVAEHLDLKRKNKVLNFKCTQDVESAAQQTRQELILLGEAYAEQIGLKNIGFFSEAMKEVLKLARQLHNDPSVPVLIEGETGTGKEVIARIIHYGEGEASTPFVALNCAAITPSVFESELFGYEGGAFTGGHPKGQKGKLDLANGGTLFLDEITEMPVGLQAKLLRVIQEKEYFRVGGLKMIKTNLRIIGATNHKIESMVAEGTFRRDLFYRLNVGRIYLLPLRERKESILPFATLFLTEFAAEKGKDFKTISKQAAKMLLSYEWPGNVRELRNAMQRVVLTSNDSELKPRHLAFLKQDVFSDTAELPEPHSNYLDFNHLELPSGSLPIEEWYDKIVCKALEMHKGNKTETAKYLGISRNSLSYRINKIKSKSHLTNEC